MRKHSLNHINSHHHIQTHDKIPYFPSNKMQRRQENTKPKRYESRKETIFGSWLYESNKQNQKKEKNTGSRKAIKTNKKNSCSYLGSNTQVDQREKLNEGLNLKSMKEQIVKPIWLTDGDVTKEQTARNNLYTIYEKFKFLLFNYRQQVQQKEKKIKELRKQNKCLRDKSMKSKANKY